MTTLRLPMRSFRLVAMVALLTLCAGQMAPVEAAQPGTVDLSPTPPDLTTSVDPNIVATFDDSGSMVDTAMGDNRPFDNGTWDGPWRCANVIDPRAPITDPIRTRGMNGAYYNPNIVYAPPLKSDGSSFLNADATLNAVSVDGIAKSRPVSPVTPATAAFNNNPDGNASVSSNSGQTKLLGTASNAWKCGGTGGSYSTVYGANNPFAATGGGPYYYQLNNTTTFIPLTDVDAAGKFTAAGLAKLYNATNWQAVSVPVAQYQNFANWYSYYRFRNLMARTAMSRVFGVLGNNIRVVWQNMNDNNYNGGSQGSTTGLNGRTITTLDNVNTDPKTNKPYRDAFFNWIFQVGASGTTPSRASEVRAGNFFSQTGNRSGLTDPYWQPGISPLPGTELACRQNFNLLMTDGLYNNPATTITGNAKTTAAAATLPGLPLNTNGITSYTVGGGAAPTTIFKGFSTDLDGGSTYSDIAFYYWANNLRPDFLTQSPPNTDKVAPYYPDLNTGVTGPVSPSPPVDTANPGKTPEIFWNPANDPATWPHLVQFAVSLGAFGVLDYSSDVDCNQNDGFGIGNDDLCKLRKGLANSSGMIGWPQPNGNSNGIPANIDDLWHAALNSRGAFFVATNPQALITQLTNILGSVLLRSTSSSQPTLSLSIATSNGASFSSGYDSADWSGNVTREIPFDVNGNQLTTPIKVWEAGCLLTGGGCMSGPNTVATPRDPLTRVILTYDGTTGKPFRWASLSGAQQAALNLNPVSVAASANPSTWTADGFGSDRVDYLRGVRTFEVPGLKHFKKRGSVLGAVVNSQPVYISSPDSGWSDNFPPGSPEDVAAVLGNSYAAFVNANKTRAATVYVGANDGMLHAFDATSLLVGSGSERWAYVPGMLSKFVGTDTTPFTKSNVNLLRYTDKPTLVPSVDSTPTKQDVFINGAWHTVLVGSLGLGGRGVYALDVTNPAGVVETNASAAQTVMWEYTNNSLSGADLGYTYGKPNIVRLHTGRWAVLVASGYFPQKPISEAYNDPASNDTAANTTSLLVLDLATGALVAELKTSTAPQYAQATATYGLSTPGVYDLGGDLVDDLAVAGDLAGNVWRFDISDPAPGNWKVDLMFKTYSVAADVGKYPVTVMPLGQRVPATRGIVWIFGTGKYIGLSDRTTGIPIQAFYGVYDAGTNPGGSTYPVPPSTLLVQTMTEDGQIPPNRFITNNAVTTQRGWTIPLNIAIEPGERNVVTGFALDSSNRTILPTLIPTTNDPCNPGRRGALLVVDAASGAAGSIGIGAGNGSTGTLGAGIRAGVIDASGAIPASGELSVYSPVGGGSIGILGIPLLNVPDNYWHRGAWRELLDLL